MSRPDANTESRAGGASLPPDVPIVLLASACWETTNPVNVHHIARRLAARGHRVLFVESTGLRPPALGSSHDLRRAGRRVIDAARGLHAVESRLLVLSPLALPGSRRRLLRALSMRWAAVSLRRACRALRFDRPVLWAFLPTSLPAADLVPHRLLVYHCVDHYAANPGVDRSRIDALEAEMLRRADLVFATSPVLAERLSASRREVHCLPNVADIALFGRAVTDDLPEPEDLRDIPRPRAVYVGNLAQYRIDLDLLDRLAGACPDVEFVFIGVVGLGDAASSGGVTARLAARENVHRLGPKPQSDLPAYLRFCDAALIPFLDNEHTRGSLPLKLWEYIASGLPVVATDLPNFAEPAEDGTVLLARDAATFAARLREAIDGRDTGRAERLAVARRHDWPQRMEETCRLIASKLENKESGAA
ncbi:MAG: glycosyltransferase [Planctomycetota bacterium]|nr:glycosyltransferase [Planctomycetota bacterium]